MFPPSSNSIGQLDLITVENDKEIKKYLEPDEKMLLITEVYKFNDYKKRQRRGLIITNKSILNLEKVKVKRKISLMKIRAITISTQGFEFIFHVPDEYDYRFISTDKRNQIIILVLRYSCALNMTKMPVFFKEEVQLTNFATTKSDKKKHISRIPTDQPQMMDDFGFQEILDADKQEHIQQQFKVIYTRDKSKDISYSDFLLLMVLGTNALGKVVLAEHKDTGEWFALKCIRKDELRNQQKDDFDLLDIRLEDHGNTPFVEQLAYIIASKHKYFIYTNFMRGGELSNHLKVGTFEDSRIKFYAGCIALGLGGFHTQNLVYKCLNPQSIMMDDHGYILLADFHWARFELQYQPKLRLMQYHYMAPESLESESDPTYKQPHDWWSYGIVIYEMAYGSRPFYGNNFRELHENIIANQPLKFPTSPDVHPTCKDLIRQLLTVDVKLRLGSKDGFEEVVTHEWFNDLNWEHLYKKQLSAPSKPNLSGEEWIEYFQNTN